MKLIPALLFLSLVVPVFSEETPDDFRYRYEVIGTGLDRPMTMRMAPDGKIYFNELDGKLRLLDPETKLIKTVGELKVFTQQESGFLGFALDPKFSENGHIFIQHSLTDFDGTAISRFTIKDEKLDLSSKKELLRWPVQRKECCHHAGEVHFGPDGNLYFSTGDNTSPFQSDGFTPIDEREGRFPFDAQKSSANTNDLRGKINRIRPTADGGYTIPEGNLFSPGTPKTRPEIFAMGFRNPWRFTIDQKTGIVYVGDVGPDSGKTKEERGPNGFDTISQLRKPGYLGWPYSRGGEVYKDFDFEKNESGETFSKSKPINASPNNTGLAELPPVQSPMIWYPHKESEEFPLMGTGGRTACAGSVFHYKPEFEKTNGFPEHYDGSLLFFDWQRPAVMWAMLDGDSNFEGLEKFTDSARVAQGDADGSNRIQIKRPVDTFFGPDGCLYFMDYGETWGKNPDAQIFKVSYQRGNLSPVAKLSVENSSGQAPLKVSLTAEGSSDPEGKDLSYEWVLNPGGKSVAKTKEAEVVIDTPGNYEIELRVSDPGGETGTASETVIVGNTAPSVTFIEPKDGDFFDYGVPMEFKIKVEDAEDGSSVDGPNADAMKFATLVTSEWIDADERKAESAVGMTLMKQSDCFNCHAMDKTIVGPTLLEIADKYRGQKGAMDVSADRVLKGSAGVWGEIPMLPHPQHTKDEIHMMVEWIFSLKKGKGGAGIQRGTEGTITVPKNEKIRKGVFAAEFTDSGKSPAGALTTTALVHVRARTIEAEAMDEIIGPKAARFNSASGKFALGNINPGHAIKVSNVYLKNIASVTIRYALPEGERKIEIRKGAIDGPKVGEIAFGPSGAWDKWKDANGNVESMDETADLYFVFDAAVNLDWVRFNK